MREDLSREEVVAIVDRLVQDLLEAAGVAGPPIDAISLARNHLGIEVCLDRRQTQRGRAQRAGGQVQIFLRPEPTEERQQWTVAHEIGEHLKPQLLARLGIDPNETRPMMGESLANLFAHHLLVPARWFGDDAPAFEFDLLAIKERYRTASHEVIALRLLDLPEPSIITIIDNDRITRRRSNSWRVRKQLEPAEAKCQRLVSKLAQPRIVRDAGWTVQGWPIHQTSWKREILRSVVDVEVE
jgi:Zn-dependent peptidase ImmA (M78 family)